MCVMGACVLVLGAAACGDNLVPPVTAPPSLPWQSGARLRAEVADAGGGAVQFLGWRDTALDVDCTFEHASDGVLRCLPTPPLTFVVYGDPACTRPIVISFTFGGCDRPVYAVERRRSDGCDGRVGGVYTIGAVRPPGRIYLAEPGSCTPLDFAFDTYEVARSVAPEEFVAATERAFAHAGGVVAHVATASDGARQVIGLTDPGGATCAPFRFPGDGGEVCVGDVVYAIPDTFIDETCSTPAPVVAATCAPAPAIGVDSAGEVHRIGAALADQVYSSVSSCGPTSGLRAWSLGPVVGAEAFPPLATVALGTGALRASWASDVEGAPLVPLGIVDSATDVACWTMREVGASDAAPRRCLPVDVPFGEVTEVYADAACAGPPVEVVSASKVGATRVALRGDSVCSELTLARLVDVRPHTGVRYARDGSGGCTELAASDRVYDVVADVPPASLPAIDVRVE